MIRSRYIITYMTAPNLRVAQKIAKALVSEHLVACANLIPNVKSVYRWKGKAELNKEVILITKSTTRLKNSIVKKVRQLHPYECPCIVHLPLVGGNKGFLEWISDETDQRNLPPRGRQKILRKNHHRGS